MLGPEPEGRKLYGWPEKQTSNKLQSNLMWSQCDPQSALAVERFYLLVSMIFLTIFNQLESSNRQLILRKDLLHQIDQMTLNLA